MLCFDVDCEAGLEFHGDVVGKDGDFLDEHSNHSLIKLCDIRFLPVEDNHKTVVRIKAINYLTEEKASLPIEKAKHIMGEYNPDENKLQHSNSSEKEKS